MQENRHGKKQIEVVTGLEPSPCCALPQPSTILLYEFVHSIPSCFNKCIITTIRLSRLSQNIRSLFCIRSQSHIGHSVSHVNLLPIKQATTLCVLQSTFLQLCKYHKHVLQPWAWDHERHITVYDLSRQRRLSVVLVYIPREITV